MKNAPILLIFLILVFTGCSSGGGDDETALPNNDACELLRLGVRIIDGTNCPESGASVVAVDLRAPGVSGLCSGTVIGARHVLTAAHCFLVANPTSVTVLAGERRLSVSRSVIHPDAEIDSEAGVIRNDAAVIETNSDIGIAPMPIAASETPSEGDIISIFGYGYDENRALGDLKSGQMKVSSVNSTHIFAEFDRGIGSNTCQGDSGGPALFTFDDDTGTHTGIAGITSTGKIESCLDGDISGFTRVDDPSILNFIMDIVPDLGAV